MIPEEEATGKVRDNHEEIKSHLEIDFVPNLYKVMASKPTYLEANWNKAKAVRRRKKGVSGPATQ